MIDNDNSPMSHHQLDIRGRPNSLFRDYLRPSYDISSYVLLHFFSFLFFFFTVKCIQCTIKISKPLIMFIDTLVYQIPVIGKNWQTLKQYYIFLDNFKTLTYVIKGYSLKIYCSPLDLCEQNNI